MTVPIPQFETVIAWCARLADPIIARHRAIDWATEAMADARRCAMWAWDAGLIDLRDAYAIDARAWERLILDLVIVEQAEHATREVARELRGELRTFLSIVDGDYPTHDRLLAIRAVVTVLDRSTLAPTVLLELCHPVVETRRDAVAVLYDLERQEYARILGWVPDPRATTDKARS